MSNQKTFPYKYWIIYFVIIIVVLLIWYFIWFYNGHHIVVCGISKNDIATFLKHFSNPLTFIISIICSILPSIVQYFWEKVQTKKEELENRKYGRYLWNLSLKHKEKVNILEKFGGITKSNNLGEDSIYGTMIDVLRRLNNEPDTQLTRKELYIFLCSPVLDTPERVNGDYTKWGEEFSGILRDLATSRAGLTRDNVHICFLSNNVIAGFKPLKGFIEVLSNYCASFEKKKKRNKKAEDIYDIIYKKTEEIYNEVVNRYRNNIHLRLLEDIPFQMIITKTDNFAEVVVSFAGKTIIEKEKTIEPKGFHSIDNDVVNAFIDIFNAYTDKGDRIPLRPKHTEDIIKLTKEKHLINKYHSNSLPDIISSPITIPANTFSPFYANSSKFTTDVLLHIIKAGDKIIEIGSGIGIQILAANRKLISLGTVTPTIWAIEPFAFEALKQNCEGLNITIKKWILRNKTTNKGSVAILCNRENCKQTTCFENQKCKYEHEIKNQDFNNEKFNIILGDLPFVSADTKKASNEEMAYYDLHHESHRSLLNLFKNAPWVAPNAILITAFSTLGGYEDTNNFTQLIQKEGLIIIQYFCYLEDDYHWIIYCLMRKEDYYKTSQDGKNYWKDRFGITIMNN